MRPIEEVEVGDLVWARDVETGETLLKPVMDLVRRHERQIWIVELLTEDGSTSRFETTDDYPWWIPQKGWVDTEDLEAGMVAMTKGHQSAIVSLVEKSERTDATYNLTVADFKTYFVGNGGILVHICPNGSYKHEFASGKAYAGKGDAKRASVSGKEIAKKNKDPLVKTETQSATSTRESLKQESRNLDDMGGPKSDSNYNKIESLGKKHRIEDGEL